MYEDYVSARFNDSKRSTRMPSITKRNHQNNDNLVKLAGGIAMLHLYRKLRDVEKRQSIQQKYPRCYNDYINFDVCQGDSQNDFQEKCQESWKEFVRCYKKHRYEE
jgi:hypothetical protein